jgi:hypothetical protein
MADLHFYLGCRIGEEVAVALPLPDYLPNHARARAMWYAAGVDAKLSYIRLHDEKARAVVVEFVRRLNRGVIESGGGWLPVKIGKGATEASVRATIVRVGGGESKFSAPASMVRDGHLPAWFVQKKLAEVAARAPYRSQRYERCAANVATIPDSWGQAYVENLLALLPAVAKA